MCFFTNILYMQLVRSEWAKTQKWRAIALTRNNDFAGLATLYETKQKCDVTGQESPLWR